MYKKRLLITIAAFAVLYAYQRTLNAKDAVQTPVQQQSYYQKMKATLAKTLPYLVAGGAAYYLATTDNPTIVETRQDLKDGWNDTRTYVQQNYLPRNNNTSYLDRLERNATRAERYVERTGRNTLNKVNDWVEDNL